MNTGGIERASPKAEIEAWCKSRQHISALPRPTGRPIATNASVRPLAKQVKIGTEMQAVFPAPGVFLVVFALLLTNLLSRDMSRPHALA